MQKTFFTLALCIFLLAGACHGDERSPQARSLAVFKNGLGFAIRTAEVNLQDGWGEIAFIPQAALGCFWLFPSSPQAYVEVARAGWRKRLEERECRALGELIRVNAGAKVRLHLTGGQAAVEGEILAMAAGAGPGQRPASRQDEGDESVLPLLHLKTRGNGVITLPLDQVRFIEWPDAYNRRLAEEKASQVLQVKVRNGGSRETVHMAYLTRGVSWLPGYWIDVKEAEKARIMLKATLLNDLEDFKDLDVAFVVGYPSFVFSHLTSPMNLEESVENFLARLSGRPAAGEGFANVMTQSVGRSSFQAGDAIGMEAGADIESAGQGAEDLFFFNQKQVTLRKGERAEYTIFSNQVPYEHVYECSLNDISGVDEWGNRDRSERNKTGKPPVWHCLKLTNTSQYPWTTGPALVLKGETPLAQNQLNYLARGATGLLRLTFAPDIAVQQGEDETGRRDDVLINRNRYTEVQVDGTVSLRNHKKEPVKVEVSKILSGAVLSASAAAKASRLTDEIRGVNPQSLIRWTFTLAAGETKKLSYTYKVYVN